MQVLYYSALIVFSAIGRVLGSDKADPDVTCKAIEPAPSGCAVRGFVTYPKQEQYPISSPQIVSSVEECASYCDRRVFNANYSNFFLYYAGYQQYCISFRYSPETGECILGKFEVSKRNVVASTKSKSYFYNSECYDCGKVCTAQQPFSSQLLDNGDFQGALLGPWYSEHGAISKGYKSSKAYHCAEEYSDSCFLSQEVNMCEGEYYALQFDYLTVQTNISQKAPHIKMGFGGDYDFSTPGTGVFVYLAHTNNTNPSAWKTVRGYFQFVSHLRLGPYFRFGGGGSTSVDNVQVSRVPRNPSLVKPEKNLFKNPGFETGDLSSWKTHDYKNHPRPINSPPFVVVSPGIDSQYAISFTSTRNAGTYASMNLEQTVATKPDTTYLVSFNAQISKEGFETRIYTGPPNAVSINIRGINIGNHTVTAHVVARTKSTRVQFEVNTDQVYPGKAILDNFKMVEIAKSKFYP